ncbi:hypothetical protein LTR66_000730 [Elasticomyces elasticus]|nr:hypothetical protein LTR66_000730 [Elasticomyces elasticus]
MCSNSPCIPATTSLDSSALGRPWHNNDSVLLKIRLDWIHQNGYTRIPDISINRIVRDALSDHQYNNFMIADRIPIHPLLRYEQWTGLSVTDFTILLPALRLATRFLDEPSILPYYRGLLHGPRRRIHAPVAERTYGRKLQMFDTEYDQRKAEDPLVGLTAQERQTQDDNTWASMFDCVKSVRLQFGGLGLTPGAYATTRPGARSTTAYQPGARLPGINGNSTMGSIIYLDPDYMTTIRPLWPGGDRAMKAYTSAMYHKSAILDDCSLLRTYFHVAKTLVHELCHAMKRASTPNGIIFGGIIHPLGYHVSAPHGLGIENWPGILNANTFGGELERGSATKWRVGCGTRYLVPMRWIHSLFTREFWDNEVVRFGLGAFKPERKVGVRKKNSNILDFDESPTDRRVPRSSESSAGSQSRFNDDEGRVHPDFANHSLRQDWSRFGESLLRLPVAEDSEDAMMDESSEQEMTYETDGFITPNTSNGLVPSSARVTEDSTGAHQDDIMELDQDLQWNTQTPSSSLWSSPLQLGVLSSERHASVAKTGTQSVTPIPLVPQSKVHVTIVQSELGDSASSSRQKRKRSKGEDEVCARRKGRWLTDVVEIFRV